MTDRPMTTEEWLWQRLEEARAARRQVDDLPPDTKMLAAVVALSNQAVLEAAKAWSQHVTRDTRPTVYDLQQQ